MLQLEGVRENTFLLSRHRHGCVVQVELVYVFKVVDAVLVV
jgi:hypothetical protein